MNKDADRHYVQAPLDNEQAMLDAVWCFFSKWSISVGTVLRVPVRIHSLIILAIVLWFYGPQNEFVGRSLAAKSISLTMWLGVILLHEMSHVLVSRHFSNYVKGIILIPPLGAIAFGTESTGRPIVRLAIFLAGPLINVLTALAVLMFQKHCWPILSMPIYLGLCLHFLWIFSLVIGLFNLLPLYPMDGGQILRNIMLLCKAGNRTADITTLIVSCLSFVGMAYLSLKEFAFNVLIIISIMMVIGVIELTVNFNSRSASSQIEEVSQ